MFKTSNPSIRAIFLWWKLNLQIFQNNTFFCLFVYWRLIAPSTTQGHLRAFTKHAHFINIKHINMIWKLVPSVLLSYKMAIKLGDAGTIDHFCLAFQYQIKKIKKAWTKGNRGDTVAQLVERRPLDPMDPMTRGSNLVRSTPKNWWQFSESKMLCWLAVSVPHPRVYMHA